MDWGSLVSGASSLIGGLFGQKSQDKSIKAQIDAQREFAQSGIRWKVADANAAGIHPLFALGANTHSFSPIGVGGSPLGEGLSQAGQSIGRAISAKGTAVERAYSARLMELQLSRGELENQLLSSQIARMNAPSQMPPPLPGGDNFLIDGQGQSTSMPLPERFGGPAIQNVPFERIVSAPGNPAAERGAVSDTGFAQTPTGLAPIPSKDFMDRTDDAWLPQIGWAMRNVALPALSNRFGRPPPVDPGPGMFWNFNPVRWEWQRQPLWKRGLQGGRFRK